MNAAKVTIGEMVAEARREMRMRDRVYPQLVNNGRMTDAQAARFRRLQGAIIDTLLAVQRGDQRALQDLQEPASGRLDL